VSNRGIGRGRMFMGALLLIAAVMTAAIGLWMSPHGETVAKGTEHVRPAIVGMMEKGAVWTLILCALSAWLLFPARRPKWPQRDWALIALLVLLVGSSLYTLIWLYGFVLR
jgi:dolichol kinase